MKYLQSVVVNGITYKNAKKEMTYIQKREDYTQPLPEALNSTGEKTDNV